MVLHLGYLYIHFLFRIKESFMMNIKYPKIKNNSHFSLPSVARIFINFSASVYNRVVKNYFSSYLKKKIFKQVLHEKSKCTIN